MVPSDRRYHPYHLLEDEHEHENQEPQPLSEGIAVHKSTIALLLGALLLSLVVNTFLAIRLYHSHFRAVRCLSSH